MEHAHIKNTHCFCLNDFDHLSINRKIQGSKIKGVSPRNMKNVMECDTDFFKASYLIMDSSSDQ